MLMRLISKSKYLIVPKGTKFTGSGKLGLKAPTEMNLASLLLTIPTPTLVAHSSTQKYIACFTHICVNYSNIVTE